MTIDWQSLAAVLVVIAAAGYLARRIWLAAAHKSSGGCGGCASCATKPAAEGERLVVLETPSSEKR